MEKIVDDLSKIINHISLSAEVFYTGGLCGIQTIGGHEGGHLHILKSGKLTVMTNEGHKVCLDTPSVIFLPNGVEHKVISSESEDATLVCATINLGSANSSVLTKSLPQFIYHEIDANDPIGSTAQWLFDEAFNEYEGRQAMINKLTDIFLLQILRDVLDKGVVVQGVLSAMTHPRLSAVIEAIHAEPEQPWTVESLADIAALSRSKFAALFKETVGQTPNQYVTDLRIAMAQNLLQQGKPISMIANEVGYEHGSALARVFRKSLGVSPSDWLNNKG